MADGLDEALVTVVGGSGFIGRYVVQALAKAGARVRVAVRDPQRAGYLKPLGGLGQIQPVEANIRSERQMAAAFEGATHGVNLVGILDERAQSFEAVQVEGAGRTARLAAAAGARAFVHISSIGADATSPAAYARTKSRGEAAVLAAFSGATVLRPSLVFGPEDGFTNRFAALATRAPFVPVVAAGTRFQPVYVADVADAVAAALAGPEQHGSKTYELGGPRAYTMREMIGWIARQAGIDKPAAEIPDGIARLLARAGDFLSFLPMNSDQFKLLGRDNVAVGPGLDTLGITPTPMEAVAPDWLVRYRRGGRFHTGPAG